MGDASHIGRFACLELFYFPKQSRLGKKVSQLMLSSSYPLNWKSPGYFGENGIHLFV